MSFVLASHAAGRRNESLNCPGGGLYGDTVLQTREDFFDMTQELDDWLSEKIVSCADAMGA